jgi:putative ABC transport system permease protein
VAEALSKQANFSADDIKVYLKEIDDESLDKIAFGVLSAQVQIEYAVKKTQEVMMAMPTEELRANALISAMQTYDERELAKYYDTVTEFSSSTYEDNLKSFGYAEVDSPHAINIYASSFENKDVIVSAIKDYNKLVDDETKEIKYTDYMGILMSSITTIIDAITYVLIAFVAISLIVSSIMIGVITLISVQERTKEIGILRSIGASKRDVSNLFNAETIIIGFASGLVGVLVTYLLCIPINLILRILTGIANLQAYLPIGAAIILVLISTGLTLLSGLIPSKSAAKKDPVVALRTE